MAAPQAELPLGDAPPPEPKALDVQDFVMLGNLLALLAGREPPPVLYHYTDAIGLSGIVSQRTFFATDAAFLNDPEEGLLALRRFLVAAKARNERGGAYATQVLAPVAARLESAKDYPYVLERAFVVAFSTERDHLDQWRAYGADGTGFSVGIRPRAFELAELSKRVIAVFAEVLYRPQVADDVLTKILDSHEATVAREQVPAETAQRQLTHALALLRLLFKDGAYSSEREWRLVILDRSGALQDVVETRVAGSVLVPYIPVRVSFPEEGKPTFVEVICGPARDRRRNALTGVFDLLARWDPNESTKKSVSQIPYRGGSRDDSRR